MPERTLVLELELVQALELVQVQVLVQALPSSNLALARIH
jgi:hypothetical protein